MFADGEEVRGSGGDRWHIERLLGQGTCCHVYQAHLVADTKQQVALKIYKKGKNYEAAHEREYLLLHLVHKERVYCPQLVKVLDNFHCRFLPCLVEELLDNDLRQLLLKTQGHGLSLCLIQRLAKDMFGGLNHLHKLGFMHGDLKPSNLLWGPRDGFLKIIDFSLSCHIKDEVVGPLQSPGYRAPEVQTWNQGLEAQAEVPADATGWGSSGEACDVPMPGLKADMWSAGTILLELLTGSRLLSREKLQHIVELPTQEKSQAVINDLVEKCFKGPDSKDPQLQELFKDLISRLLCIDCTQRIHPEDAFKHSFFANPQVPSDSDLMLLPSCVLRLLNLVQESETLVQDELADMKEDIVDECKKYGEVVSCILPVEGATLGKVFVEFASPSAAQAAFEGMCQRTFNKHVVLCTYLPPQDFKQSNYY